MERLFFVLALPFARVARSRKADTAEVFSESNLVIRPLRASRPNESYAKLPGEGPRIADQPSRICAANLAVTSTIATSATIAIRRLGNRRGFGAAGQNGFCLSDFIGMAAS